MHCRHIVVVRMIQFSRKTRCDVRNTSLVVYGKHDTPYDIIILCYINNTWRVCVCVCDVHDERLTRDGLQYDPVTL